MGLPALAAFLTLLSVATVGGAARKDPGEYWVAVMKEEPMPEAIRGLVRGLDSRPEEDILPSHTHHGDHKMNKDCLTGTSTNQEEKKSYADGIEPRPNISAYGDDGVKLTEEVKKKVTDDFEPRPSVTDYRGKGKEEQQFKGDFEPRPSVTDYRGKGKGEQQFKGDFEPRPNVSAYADDGVKLTEEVKKELTEDFEPRPSVTDYRGKEKEKKSFTEDFEPRPNISIYQG